jgi:hypothetical protein
VSVVELPVQLVHDGHVHGSEQAPQSRYLGFVLAKFPS